MGIEDFDARWQVRNGKSLFRADEDGALLRDAVARSLKQGRFRIILTVDAINSPLKRMVEYLNAMSGPGTSVIAVEYARLTQGSVEMPMAQTYGEELAGAKAASASRERTVWDTETHRTWLEEYEPASVPNFSAFIDEAAALGLEFEGSLAVTPTGGLRISDAQGRRLGTVSLFHFSGQRTSVEFNLIPMSRLPEDEWPGEDAVEAFLVALSNAWSDGDWGEFSFQSLHHPAAERIAGVLGRGLPPAGASRHRTVAGKRLSSEIPFRRLTLGSNAEDNGDPDRMPEWPKMKT